MDQVCKKPSLKIADSFNLKFVSLQDNRYKIFFNFQKSILYWEDNLTEQTMMTTQANLWRAFSPSMKYRTPWTVDSCPKSKMQKIKIWQDWKNVYSLVWLRSCKRSFQKMKVKQRNDNSCREYRNSGRLNLQVLREVFQIHPFPKTLVLSANIGDWKKFGK